MARPNFFFDAVSTDRTGAGQSLHPRGDVDPITVNVALVDDNVADLDADAEYDPAIFRNIDITLGHPPLNVHGTPHGVDGARKFD
jgi:hypothetical protein